MVAQVILGTAAQPSISGQVILGEAPGAGSSLLDFTLPTVARGTVILIAIVRNGESVSCSDLTWERVDGGGGVGAGDVFVDLYAKKATGSEGGTVVSFLSITAQELQGGLVILQNVKLESLVYEVQHAAFTDASVLAAPAITVLDRNDTLMLVYSSSPLVDLEEPAGSREIDDYGGSVFSSRALVIATMRAGAAGLVTPPSATSSPISTGRAFTVGLRFVRLTSGHALREPAAHATNPSGHAARDAVSTITNPSRHARKTP